MLRLDFGVGFWNVGFHTCRMKNQSWSFGTLEDSIHKRHKEREEREKRHKKKMPKLKKSAQNLVPFASFC